MYDLIIIGGGPAGSAAAVYAARKKLKSVIIAEEFGGQSKVSLDVQNWIGSVSISGSDLAKNLKAHVEAYATDVLDIKEGELAEGIEKKDENFVVKTNKGSYEGTSVLISSGSSRRKLPAKGAKEFDGKGLVYCASCDGPLFSGMDVAVVGGGNAGFETAAQLLEYATSVTMFERSPDSFKAEDITVKKVLAHPKMKVIMNSEITEVAGENMVSSIKYKDLTSEKESELAVKGVFVEIGQIPNTNYAKGIVDMTDYGQVKIDARNQRTSVSGIWAAGDCTDVLYHQNNIAVGDAVRAVEDIFITLKAI